MVDAANPVMANIAAMKRGRPSTYRDAYADQARKLCEFGATEMELADFFNVTVPTVRKWAVDYPAFLAALKLGKEAADERVKRSLYHKAIGYSFDSVKIFQHGGGVVEVPYREHVPPDTTACIFWLKNRRPDLWRDKIDVHGQHQHEHRHAHLHASVDKLAGLGLDLARYSPEQLEAVRDFAALTNEAPTRDNGADDPRGGRGRGAAPRQAQTR